MSSSKNKWYSYIYNPKCFYLVVVVFLCLGISSFLGYYTPRKISQLFGAYEKKDLFYEILKFLIFLFCAEYLNRVVYQICINRYIQKSLQVVRSRSYDNWLNRFEMNSKDSERYPLGEVLARLMNDSDAILELVSSGSFAIFVDIIFIISCLVSFIELNTVSGTALIIFEVIISLGLIWGSKYMARVFMSVRRSSGMMSRTLANIIGGVRDIYYTPNHGYAFKQSYLAFEDFLQKQLKANVWDASYYSIAESLYPLLLALLIFIFPYSQITEVAVFAAIIDLIQRSIGPIKDITGKISNIQRAKTGLDRIVSFNNDLEKLPESLDFLNFNQDFTEVVVEVESFQYDNTNRDNSFILGPVKIVLKKGELLGIAGFSGSGKSTLLKILSGDIHCPSSTITFVDSQQKSLIFDTSNAEDFQKFKQIVSLVSQDSHLFSESLAFNISFSDKIETVEEFWNSACEQIEYIRKWNIKLTDDIDPKQLSLGQKQLISALRACFLRKPLVLFDEISSALDPEIELALRKMILIIQQHSMTLIVAHRLETLIDSHHLALMDEGRIVDEGRHQDLFKSSALYQKFIRQLSNESGK